ncbi:MAG TPA: hypothetical protein DDW20_05765 [Firmicutes bacterium]|nr:hypothetical protein [Bacillota bacterium]
MANLSLKHLYKIYDNGTKAVSDFNLEIKDDEFIVFVGPSGCGKSTTLRMIAGLEDITAGDFYIDDVLANSLEPKDRDMAMVFQNYALYPHMSVYDNMAFGLKIRHVPKEEIDLRVHQAAKILDIEDQLDKKPKAMSGGQRQRVALGRAIVRKPKVFLLDEPLSNLDAKLRSSMRSEITRLHNILKTTFIYVTHDQVEAMTMGTRIVVMKKGVIQQVDTPMNLYDYPANLFVAGFIGTPQMNFINANFSLNDNFISLQFSNVRLLAEKDSLPKLDLYRVYKNEDVILGIRPEHFKIVNKGDKNSFLLKISNIESLGNEMNIEGFIDNGEQKIVVRSFRNDYLSIGDEIYVGVDFNKIHLFSKENEETLLPRIPNKITVNCVVKDKKLEVFGKRLCLPNALNGKLIDGKYQMFIYQDAIKEGTTFNGKIIKKEFIDNKYLYTIKINNEFVFLYCEKNIVSEYVNFDIDLRNVAFYQNFECVVAKFITYSNIDGKLVPTKKIIHFQTNRKDKNGNYIIKEKMSNVFDYEIEGHRLDVNEDTIKKIHALLGKQFALHDIRFSLPANKICFVNEGMKGNVSNIYEYDEATYYEVNVNGNLILVENNDKSLNIGDEVNLSINSDDIGVFDKNFEVTLI